MDEIKTEGPVLPKVEKVEPDQVLKPGEEGSYQCPPLPATPPNPPKPVDPMVPITPQKDQGILDDGIVSLKEFNKTTKQIIYERVDIMNLTIVLIVGGCIILSIIYNAKDIANTLGGGLIGFLGKTISGNGSK